MLRVRWRAYYMFSKLDSGAIGLGWHTTSTGILEPTVRIVSQSSLEILIYDVYVIVYWLLEEVADPAEFCLNTLMYIFLANLIMCFYVNL